MSNTYVQLSVLPAAAQVCTPTPSTDIIMDDSAVSSEALAVTVTVSPWIAGLGVAKTLTLGGVLSRAAEGYTTLNVSLHEPTRPDVSRTSAERVCEPAERGPNVYVQSSDVPESVHDVRSEPSREIAAEDRPLSSEALSVSVIASLVVGDVGEMVMAHVGTPWAEGACGAPADGSPSRLCAVWETDEITW